MTATRISLREMAREALAQRQAVKETERINREYQEGEVLYRLMKERLGYDLGERPTRPEVDDAGLRFRVRYLGGQHTVSPSERYHSKWWRLEAAYICPGEDEQSFVTINNLADLGDLIEANDGPLSDIPF